MRALLRPVKERRHPRVEQRLLQQRDDSQLRVVGLRPGQRRPCEAQEGDHHSTPSGRQCRHSTRIHAAPRRELRHGAGARHGEGPHGAAVLHRAGLLADRRRRRSGADRRLGRRRASGACGRRVGRGELRKGLPDDVRSGVLLRGRSSEDVEQQCPVGVQEKSRDRPAIAGAACDVHRQAVQLSQDPVPEGRASFGNRVTARAIT
mmetsp:Transcript_59030/g.170656  ORF Transcript_59030/g.170656 Transcript_59030/m.170656 type:complete len:205 (-) Transcript_59030:474-1088(-)